MTTTNSDEVSSASAAAAAAARPDRGRRCVSGRNSSSRGPAPRASS